MLTLLHVKCAFRVLRVTVARVMFSIRRLESIFEYGYMYPYYQIVLSTQPLYQILHMTTLDALIRITRQLKFVYHKYL